MPLLGVISGRARMEISVQASGNTARLPKLMRPTLTAYVLIFVTEYVVGVRHDVHRYG